MLFEGGKTVCMMKILSKLEFLSHSSYPWVSLLTWHLGSKRGAVKAEIKLLTWWVQTFYAFYGSCCAAIHLFYFSFKEAWLQNITFSFCPLLKHQHLNILSLCCYLGNMFFCASKATFIKLCVYEGLIIIQFPFVCGEPNSTLDQQGLSHACFLWVLGC